MPGATRAGARYASLLFGFVAFLVLANNLTFFDKLTDVYAWREHAGFIVSLAILQASLLVILVQCFSLLLTTRLTIILFLLIGSAAAYFTDTYGTIIDTTMLQNMVETNLAEAADLFNPALALRLTLFGILPAILAYFVLRNEQPFFHRLSTHAAITAVSVLLSAACLLTYSDSYASFFREHKTVRLYSNPIYPVYSAMLSASEQFSRPAGPFEQRLADAHQEHVDTRPKLMVMVVGETARPDHFSLYGYRRETTPLMDHEAGIVTYDPMTACGTTTAVSVPCMFSFSPADSFERDQIYQQENVLDVLARVGVSVLWRDNNSSSKGVADRVAYEDFRDPAVNRDCDEECRDPGMLKGLQSFINEQSGDILIVLHQMGNHGPAYASRYPRAFEVFQPACRSAELADCSPEEIRNAYDNAIRYTDYFLAEVVALLRQNTNTFDSAMLYVGDHGESLGENGLYLHGMPKMLAPSEQLLVPLLLWLPENSSISHESALAHQHDRLSHDAISSTLLKLFDVESTEISPGPLLFEKGGAIVVSR